MGKLIVCADCGEKRPYAAHGLCHVCYEKTRIIECTRCKETKRRAAHGLCHRCYKQVHRDPGIVERMAAREATDAEKEQAYTQQLTELLQRRCRTCRRVLSKVRDPLHWRARHCDKFCYSHHPDRRKARGSTWWQPKVLARLEARRAEARQAEVQQVEHAVVTA